MIENFVMSFDPDVSSPEVVLEVGIYPFSRASFVVANLFRWCQLYFFALAFVEVNNRDMSEGT